MSEHRPPLRFVASLREFAESIRRALGHVPADLAVWADIRAFPPLAVIAGLDCLAGLVLWRKLAGGPPLVLTNMRLCLTSLAVSTLIVAGRWWLARIERESPAVWLRTLLMALAIVPMLALLSLANSHHSPWAVSCASALAVVSGGAVLLWKRSSPAKSAAAQAPAPQPRTLPFPATPVASSSRTDAGRAGPVAPPGTLVGRAHDADGATDAAAGAEREEWMVRTTDASGAVKMRGQVLADFAAGQSVVTVHIPFCPAFSRLPEFTCEVEGVPSVRPRAPAVFRYGVRVELKRAGDTSNAARARLRYHASTRADSSRAA